MTVKSINEQISTIREATEKAAVSPEAALAFLRKAGIVPVQPETGRYTSAAKAGPPIHKVTIAAAAGKAARKAR